MSNNLSKETEWLKKLEKSLEPEYKQISEEIKPLIMRVLTHAHLDKKESEYVQLKENAVEWFDRFQSAVKIAGKVVSLQKLEITVKEPQILLTLKLFQYLGIVESIGSTMVDMLVLLLIADGQHFHVERSYDLPRIAHARNFRDLDPPSSTLAEKLQFLEGNGLKISSQIINRKLRNDIAHLNFDINDQGEISTKHCGKVDVDREIRCFGRIWLGFLLILLNSSFVDFLSRVMNE